MESASEVNGPHPSALPTLLADEVKRQARSIGFSACGLAPAQRVDDCHADAFRAWIDAGRHADMHYMADHADKRMDPRLLLDGAQTVISLALNYYPHTLLSQQQLQFAYYAYGLDYHDVVRRRLHELCTRLGLDPQRDAKLCCDTVPILDRYWAWRAGLGWMGRNKNLILPHRGSYFFLAEIVTTRAADAYDAPLPDHCGSCRRCAEACPTGALQLSADGQTTLDARRCLSYLTIENRSELPHDAARQMGHCIYGCDRCQQACPHNRFAQPTDCSDFEPRAEFLAMQPADWSQLTREQYQQLFRGTAVKRAKFEGLQRNIAAVVAPTDGR